MKLYFHSRQLILFTGPTRRRVNASRKVVEFFVVLTGVGDENGLIAQRPSCLRELPVLHLLYLARTHVSP